MKKLVIILGNIGTGKTTICKELVKHDFAHLAIDNFYLKAKRTEDIKNWWEDKKYCNEAYELMRKEVLKELNVGPVVIESTGASKHAIKMFKKLESINKIKIYRIMLKAPIKVLKERIKKRNSSDWKLKNTMQQITITSKVLNQLKPKVDYTINANKEMNKVKKEVSEIVT